jgi:hypothetical protein
MAGGAAGIWARVGVQCQQPSAATFECTASTGWHGLRHSSWKELACRTMGQNKHMCLCRSWPACSRVCQQWFLQASLARLHWPTGDNSLSKKHCC